MIEFIVPGKAQAKQRPRFNTNTGRAYTPNKTTSYENWVKTCYCNKYFKNELLECPLTVIIDVAIAVPDSFSKRKRELALNDEIKVQVKPDIDNIAKSILDALNGIAYKDDKQIIELKINKRYDTIDFTRVKIEEKM